MDRSEVGGFLIGFVIYIMIFSLSLFVAGRIKSRHQRAAASGVICLVYLLCPWLFFLAIGLALSGPQAFKYGLFYMMPVSAIITGLTAL